MPIEFPEVTEYSLDYQNILAALIDQCEGMLFDDPKLTVKYLSHFVDQLKSYDFESCNKLKVDSTLRLKLRQYYKYNEIFQHTLGFYGEDAYIHFDVDKILKYLEKTKRDGINTEVHSINIGDFYGPTKNFLWTPNNYPSTKPDPLIAVPYPHYYQNYLIIDGNSRLTTFGKSKKALPVIIIAPQELITLNFFLSDFDKYLYIFQLDFANLTNIKHNENPSDSSLLDRSFIRSMKSSFGL